MKSRCVWISSPPRTGSMWVFNIIRDLYRNRNYQITPENVLIHPYEWTQARNKFVLADSEAPNLHRACIVKSHQPFIVSAQRADETLFMTLRDPRDSLASYMRFMDMDAMTLEQNWRSILQSHVGFVTHMTSHHQDRLTLLLYKDIKSNPHSIIKTIMQTLDEDATAEDLALAEKYSKRNVKESIEKSQKQHQDSNDKNSKIGTFLKTHSESSRYLDYKTGFQAGHVSEYEDGNWGDILPPTVADQITHFLQPYLEAYGFPE